LCSFLLLLVLTVHLKLSCELGIQPRDLGVGHG
jgi:hypothetical protein